MVSRPRPTGGLPLCVGTILIVVAVAGFEKRCGVAGLDPKQFVPELTGETRLNLVRRLALR
ncbi:hypothetical protein predicted by Glimmer/Critica (plasmid) [Sinorhizobium fredii HH103]|uniref:Uncharacterized protein n=1 Tax=Sinorhizobium fredii (strain HH103) TaxID=1117943 RepID=G9AF06_SINF1|nr:hypothetical protein predicted by Glimmer/Critica [Sinorhizobium fredii HH103]